MSAKRWKYGVNPPIEIHSKEDFLKHMGEPCMLQPFPMPMPSRIAVPNRHHTLVPTRRAFLSMKGLPFSLGYIRSFYYSVSHSSRAGYVKRILIRNPNFA